MRVVVAPPPAGLRQVSAPSAVPALIVKGQQPGDQEAEVSRAQQSPEKTVLAVVVDVADVLTSLLTWDGSDRRRDYSSPHHASHPVIVVLVGSDTSPVTGPPPCAEHTPPGSGVALAHVVASGWLLPFNRTCTVTVKPSVVAFADGWTCSLANLLAVLAALRTNSLDGPNGLVIGLPPPL